MNFQDFQKVIKEEVSLDEMDSIMDIVNYTESVKDSEFASEDELATELKEMLNSIGLDFDSEALTAMEDSVEIPLTYMDDGSAEAILSVFAQDGEGKEIDGELTLKVERLGEGKFYTTILAKFGEDEAKELGDIEFELAEELEDEELFDVDDDEKPRSSCTCWRSKGQRPGWCPACKTQKLLNTQIPEEITDDDDFEDGYDPIYEAKAVSTSQQKAAGAALAAKRGDIPVSKLFGASKEMYDSMSEKELKRMASVKHSKLNEEDEKEKKDDGMETEPADDQGEAPENSEETPVEETEKKYIMSEKELRAVVSWLLKNEDKIEATEEGIDGAVAEIEATFADEFEDEEGEEEMSEGEPKPEDDDEMPVMEPEEDPNSPVEVYEEVRYDAAWNVILYKPQKRYFISKLFTKDEVKSKNDIEKYVQKNYPDFMIFHIFDIMEVF